MAGKFYPGDPAELRDLISILLAQPRPPKTEAAPKAIIAPHAGYIYSGPIAASAYAQFAPARDLIKRIILLGPSHYIPFRGLAIPSVEAFATPLGTIPLDLGALRQIKALPQVCVLDEAHEREHSLEVQLPFLQMVLASFTLLPLAVGEAAPDEVAQVLEMLWGGSETRFVISSDLSHYHDLQVTRRLDHATARAIEGLQAAALDEGSACGRIPIGGMLQAAQHRGLHARTLDLRTSGDTAGPRDRVVGYGAFAFQESAG